MGAFVLPNLLVFKPLLANILILYHLLGICFYGFFSGYKMGTLPRNGLEKLLPQASKFHDKDRFGSAEVP